MSDAPQEGFDEQQAQVEQDAVLKQISENMQDQHQRRQRLEKLLQVFTARLYEGFEEALNTIKAREIPGFGEPRYLKHPAGGWRRIMQLPIEDWRIVIVPLVGTAWPNPVDEAMIPSAAFKAQCARVAFYLVQHEDPHVTAFYDAIILADASWFAWGYGWPKQQDDVAKTNFKLVALDLLESFTKDIFVRWAPRDETTLAVAMDGKKRAYRFGLPGDDDQGGS